MKVSVSVRAARDDSTDCFLRVASQIAAARRLRCMPVYALMYCCYFSLAQVGQTFLHFQVCVRVCVCVCV